jgi:uncharacterized protein (UPF0332 family)
LKETQAMMEKGFFNAAVNRLYYACFYAVSSLLLTRNLVSSKHRGVLSLFNQNFVKPAIVNNKWGRFYKDLYENRQHGDYVDFTTFDKEEVENLFREGTEFVEMIAELVEK